MIKSSYKHASDSEQLQSYDHLKLGKSVTDYRKDKEQSNNHAHYLINLMFIFNFMKDTGSHLY